MLKPITKQDIADKATKIFNEDKGLQTITDSRDKMLTAIDKALFDEINILREEINKINIDHTNENFIQSQD